jgi:metal-responsive CopG/Arc/MetJ family transcriptional regulator
MTTRTIQMTVDDSLLAEVDAATKDEGVSRSAFIRSALEDALRRIRVRQLERLHAEAFARTPQTDYEIEVWASLQDWGER